MKLNSLFVLPALALAGCFYTAPEDPVFAGTYSGTATYSMLNTDGSPGPAGSLPLTAKVDGAISLELGAHCALFFTTPINEQTDGGASTGNVALDPVPHMSGCQLPTPSGVVDFAAEGGLTVVNDSIQIDVGAGSGSWLGGAEPSFYYIQLTYQGTRAAD